MVRPERDAALTVTRTVAITAALTAAGSGQCRYTKRAHRVEGPSRVHRAAERPYPMPSVSVPAEFFRGELRVYSDWRTAFARELIQNSLDAGATRIDIDITEQVRGTLRDDSIAAGPAAVVAGGSGAQVRFVDDGSGMSRRTLEEVFFALGRTTKTDPGAGAIGGFGRARMILCFAQDAYRIRTRDQVVFGRGGDYTLTDAPTVGLSPVEGTEFVIDTIDTTPSELVSAFRRLIGTCALPVPVYLNGDLLSAPVPAGRARRVLRDPEGRAWASVYVASSNQAYLPGQLVGAMHGAAHVRVAGLTMFTRWLPTADRICVELRPGRAREVLSASRDTLIGRFEAQLDEFVSQLASNRQHAFAPDAQPLAMTVYGGGMLLSAGTPPPSPATGEATGKAPSREVRSSSEGPDRDTAVGTAGSHEGAVNGPAADPVADPVEGSRGDSVGGSAEVGVGRPVRVVSGELCQARVAPAPAYLSKPAGVPGLPFDVHLAAKVTDARTRRLARTWNPAEWSTRTSPSSHGGQACGVNAGAGGRRRALLLGWVEAVRVCLEALLEVRPEVGPVAWTPGWVFDETTIAAHRRVAVAAPSPATDDGHEAAAGVQSSVAHVLSLNPVRAGETIAYRLTDRRDRADLLASAAHEVAHVVCSEHDELFASVLTDLMAQVDQRAALSQIAAAARA